MRLLPLLLLAPTLLMAPAWQAGATLIDGPDGSVNTEAPADDPGFGRVGKVWIASGVHIGLGRVVTASHVALADLRLDGVVYPAVPGSKVQLQPVGGASEPPDLAVFRVDPYPDQPLLPIRSSAPLVGDAAVLVGRGRNRGAATTWISPTGPVDGYLWGSGKIERWGTSHVTDLLPGLVVETTESDSFSMEFTAGVGPDEGIAAEGDSGGAVFLQQGGDWELAGIMFALSTYPDQPAQTALYGNATLAVDLSPYRDQILALLNPRCSDGVDNDGDSLIDLADPGCLDGSQDFEDAECNDGADNDGDGDVDLADAQCTAAWVDLEDTDADADAIGDTADNCLLVANTGQCDTNQDGYGNLCDADLNDDGITGIADFSLFKLSFGATGFGACGHVADLNGDGAVGITDFSLFQGAFGQPPGPSGLACAGSVPCPGP